jgi:hypothetical protein
MRLRWWDVRWSFPFISRAEDLVDQIPVGTPKSFRECLMADPEFLGKVVGCHLACHCIIAALSSYPERRLLTLHQPNSTPAVLGEVVNIRHIKVDAMFFAVVAGACDHFMIGKQEPKVPMISVSHCTEHRRLLFHKNVNEMVDLVGPFELIQTFGFKIGNLLEVSNALILSKCRFERRAIG